MVKIRARDGGEFQAYLALPAGGFGPGLVVMQSAYGGFGVNKVMRNIADGYASKGFVVIVPDLFWRQEPGVELTDQTQKEWERAFKLYQGLDEAKAVDDSAAAMQFLRRHNACTGKVGGVGFSLGGKLAYLLAVRHDPDCAVGYYGVGIEEALDEAPNLRCPLVLHVGGRDQYCDSAAQAEIHERLDQNPLVTIYDYPKQGHAFARVGGEHYDAAMAELANLRTLEFFREHLGVLSSAGAASQKHDFAALWEDHIKYEFDTRNHEDTLNTMVEDAYVNHIPTLTGGVGKKQLEEFYATRFIPQMPPDTQMTPISRTIGSDRLVDEMIFKFTHTVEMDWMVPGIAPTGKRVEVPLVAIVHFRDGKLAHEHIYWDQASVLVQLGLLDPTNLPVAGIETAQKVLDNTIPSNALIERADHRKRKGMM